MFDQKGSHARHTAKCSKFREEARKRRTNYRLANSAPLVDGPHIAEGSNHPQVSEDDVVEVEQQMQLEDSIAIEHDMPVVSSFSRFYIFYNFLITTGFS